MPSRLYILSVESIWYLRRVTSLCSFSRAMRLRSYSRSKSIFSLEISCSFFILSCSCSRLFLIFSISNFPSLAILAISSSFFWFQYSPCCCSRFILSLLAVVSFLVSFSSADYAIFSSDACLIWLIFSWLSSSICCAFICVSCLNSACRSLNRRSEEILTSVISTVSSQMPHPFIWSFRSFTMLSRRCFLFRSTSLSVELAIRFLRTDSHMALTLRLASPPSMYLQQRKGPSPSRKTLQKAKPVMMTPCISLVTLLAVKVTLQTLEGNLTKLSEIPRYALSPIPDLMSLPSLITNSHSLGVAYTKRLRMKRIARMTMIVIAAMVAVVVEVVALLRISVIWVGWVIGWLPCPCMWPIPAKICGLQ